MINPSTEIYFNEVQRFRQPLLWIFFGVVSIIVLFSLSRLFLRYIAAPKVAGKASLFVVIFAIFTLVAVGSLLFFSKLETQVRPNGLYLRFFPFHMSFQHISLENVIQHKVITYSPFKDYGGWGIRNGSKGKAYNVSGNRGVLLIWPDKQICIGSQQSEALANAIDRLRGTHNTLPNPTTPEKKEGE